MGLIIVIDDSLLRDFEALKKAINLMLKLKKPYSVEAFLIPDETYDALIDILKPVKPDIEEYSTRKWLTGFIPDVDKAFYYKIYSILHRKDVKKISQFYENLKSSNFKDAYEQTLAALDLGAMVLVDADEAEKYLERKPDLIEIDVKKVKGVVILKT